MPRSNQGISLKRLKQILDEEFSPPFCPEGMVQAQLVNNTLDIRIGPRDITIDRSGKVSGSGTNLSFAWTRTRKRHAER